MKRSLIRVAIAGALTAPVLFMASGVASADSSSYGASADNPGAHTKRACSEDYADDKGSEHYGDKYGHDKNEYDKSDRYGYDKTEYDKSEYDKSDKYGHDKSEYSKYGHDKSEYSKYGHDKSEYSKHEYHKGHHGHGLLGVLLGL